MFGYDFYIFTSVDHIIQLEAGPFWPVFFSGGLG
jgi:hypothetical protein